MAGIGGNVEYNGNRNELVVMSRAVARAGIRGKGVL